MTEDSSGGDPRPRVAVFRPSDEREEKAIEALREGGFEPLTDPLLGLRPTGVEPRKDADYTVLTSVTGARIVGEVLKNADTSVCAIGPKTRDALERRDIGVDVVPEEYTSQGLVEALDRHVGGSTVEVARSDHGSGVLTDGLNESGAYVHETVLYELYRPEGGGLETVHGVCDGSIDAVLFTSSLTVQHLLEAFEEEGKGPDSLEGVVVGTIGEPTRETAEKSGIEVDFVPETETFEGLIEGLEDCLS